MGRTFRSGKTTAVARGEAANEADLQGWHEARGGDRSVTGKNFAQPARSDGRRFVLESHPAVARCRDPKSLDRPHASSQSNFTNDREMDTAYASCVFHLGAA